MTTRVLVPVDGSPHSKAAAEYAVELYPDATLVLLHVLGPPNVSPPDGLGTTLDDVDQSDADDLFEEVRDRLDDTTIETATTTGNPAREIVAYAEVDENNIDAIVMGSHGRDGAARILLGSVAETVVRRSPVPVTVDRS